MESKLILIGDGGHCKSIADSLSITNEYKEIAFVSKERTDNSVLDLKCLGTDDDLKRLFDEGWNYAFIAVGSVGDTSTRRKLYKEIKEIGFKVPNIIDRSSIISENVKLGEGIFVGKGAIINTNSIIGNNAIINTGSIIEHDCKIGNFVHVSPNSTVCGETVIKDDAHIGAGSSIKQCTTIGSNTLIGLGSVVVNDIEDNCVAYGNPCKVVKKK